MPNKISTIEDVYKLAGSPQGLAAALKVHQVTVDGWREYGIPVKYWEKLNVLYELTPTQLYNITKKCREDHKNGNKR